MKFINLFILFVTRLSKRCLLQLFPFKPRKLLVMQYFNIVRSRVPKQKALLSADAVPVARCWV